MCLNDKEYELENPFGLDTDSDFHAMRKRTTISLIKEYLRNTEAINLLDVGCGRGNITKFINQQIPIANIDAIDISEKAIRLAESEVSKIHFINADAMSYDANGLSYNIILLNNIYEHVENPVAVLLNLKKMLTEDGIIIISTPNRYSIKNIIRKLIGLRIFIPTYHITEYSLGQLYDHHQYAGLKIKRVIMPKFKTEKFRLKDILIFNFLLPITDIYFKLLKSRTRLGTTLFIVSSNDK